MFKLTRLIRYNGTLSRFVRFNLRLLTSSSVGNDISYENVVLSKYFDEPETLTSPLLKELTVGGVEQAISIAIQESDKSSLFSLLKQTSDAKLHSNETIEAIRSSDSLQIPLSVRSELLSDLVDNFLWTHAYHVLLHIIKSREDCSSFLITQTLKGLLSSASSIVLALELVKTIIESRSSYQGHDLSVGRTFNVQLFKVKTFKNFESVPVKSEVVVPIKPIKDALDAMLVALEKGNWSYRQFIALLLGIANTSGHFALTSDFIKKSMEIVSLQDKNKDRSNRDDMLGLLDCLTFAEIISLDYTAYSTATLDLLSELVARSNDMKLVHNGFDSPGNLQSFLSHYWYMAHKSKSAALNPLGSTTALTTDVIDEVHLRSLKLYNRLYEFCVSKKTSHTFVVDPGFDRRVFRYLCDGLHLEHKILSKPNNMGDMQQVIKVFKVRDNNDTSFEPPGYPDIIIPHNSKFDGEPLYWSKIKQHLSRVDGKVLDSVVEGLCRTISKSTHHSVSWGLLFWEVLNERRIPISTELASSIIVMCGLVHDYYGLMEILYAVRDETKRVKLGNNRPLELLSQDDWSNAFLLIRSMRHWYTDEQFEAMFNEVIEVMNQCEVEATGHLLLVLLSFAVNRRPTKRQDVLNIVNSMVQSKTYEISHKECKDLSFYLHKNFVPHTAQFLKVVNVYKREYLIVYFGFLEKLSYSFYEGLEGEGQNADKFRKLWSQVHTNSGRENLLSYLNTLLSSAFHHELASNEYYYLRVCQIVIYLSYLLSLHDGKHRDAFELLANLANSLENDELYRRNLRKK